MNTGARFAFLFLLLLAACKGSPLGQSTPAPGQVLFQDDFTDPKSGWNRVAEPNGQSDYDDGAYRILVSALNTDIWTRPGLDFTDVRLEVDAFKAGGDRNNRFGLICRVTGGSSFYLFLISSDGYYGIGKVKGEAYELIGMEALLPSEAIHQGTASNHLRADCVGDRLVLFANGEKLAEVQDGELKSGDVGLIAGAYDKPGTDIRFDNFSVLEPEAEPQATEQMGRIQPSD